MVIILKDLKMKYYKILIILVCISSFGLISCEEEGTHAPVGGDDQSPDPVTNIVLTPTPGGFDVKFKAPTNTDLLYVKADFQTQGLGATELRASKYDNSFVVRGFATEEEKTITFIAVDKSGNESSKVTAVGTPLRAPILDVETTMKVNVDFGGARFTWQNLAEGNLVIDLLAENEFGELEVAQTLYSTVVDGLYNLRGYEPVPTKFAVVVSDQYKNRTDTIYPDTPDKLLTPLLETALDKDFFSQYLLITGDELWNTFGGVVTELWDDVTHNSGNYARATLVQPRTFFTMDLGVNVKLSRFKLHQRRTRYMSEGAPKEYTIYGTNEVPSEDGDMSGWTKLRDCVATTPSGNTYVGENNQVLSNEDLEYAINGDEFALGGTPEVRYIRIEFTKNFRVSSFIIFSELSFWGEIQ